MEKKILGSLLNCELQDETEIPDESSPNSVKNYETYSASLGNCLMSNKGCVITKQDTRNDKMKFCKTNSHRQTITKLEVSSQKRLNVNDALISLWK